MKKLWYYIFKIFIKTALFFYSKKIIVTGKNNIPRKGAVLFASNHPNGLIDPLILASHNPRILHFLVRAAVFKKPIIKKFLATLNLMPIYRMRDGVKQLSKNQEIFDQCYTILKNEKSLLIFPEGSHDKKRRIRPISKGFARIVFGAIEKYPHLKIKIIPVGLTYQSSSVYPSKVILQYGTPIVANDYYSDQSNTAINKIKQAINEQLKTLTVHIENDEKYNLILDKLNHRNTDFTKVDYVNKMIIDDNYIYQKKKNNYIKNLKYLIILNLLIPYIVWKKASKNIDELEFIDTFRFGLGALLTPIFLGLQSYAIHYFYCFKYACIYLIISILLLFIYAKFSNLKIK